ncbi:MAG: MarC family protein [Salaquimonas sp.]
MPTYDTILNAFVTLFVTVDPIGNAPLFLGLTAGMAAADKRSVALRAVIIAFLILTLFAITGTMILDAMGITIHAFRMAGGLLLFYTAFEMIYAKRQERKEEASQSAIKDKIANIAVFPLAIPLIAGPGAISATILLSSQLSVGDTVNAWTGTSVLVGVIFVLMSIALVVLFSADLFDKYLGNTGRMVLTRLLGVLLAALSVQYVADGATALFVG